MVAIGQEMVREKLDVWQKSGKSEILRVHIYSSPSFLLLFCNIEILILQTYMEGMAMRGGLSPYQVLMMCETVNSVGQRNFTLVRKKSGESQGILKTSGCGNHVPVL